VTAKKYFFLTALPRCGNTLLAVLINQHKNIKVTANSLLPEIFNSLFLLKKDEKFLNFPDHKSLENVVRSVFDSYYSHWDCDYVIDRSSWGQEFNLNIINTLFNKNKFIILKRPMKEILNSFASICKEDNRSKYLENLLNKNTVLTNNIESIKNLMSSDEDKIIINYKDLVENTNDTIQKIFDFLCINEKPLKYKLKQLNINNVLYEDKQCNIDDMHLIHEDGIQLRKESNLLNKNILNKCKELDNYIWS